MQKNYYLGMMSGTSFDGVDLALVEICTGKVKNRATAYFPMPDTLRQTLKSLVNGEIDSKKLLQTLGETDSHLGKLYAECVNRFLAENGISSCEVAAIGCHGQTVWHSPQGDYPFSFQLGNAEIIVAETGITTVADFRRKDIAYGGQGAPLVPAFHREVFFDPSRLTVVLNIGGISNISVLFASGEVLGYDTGVGNALMDFWIEKHCGKPYDKSGHWAASGKMNAKLLDIFLQEPFLCRPAPKSTGRELFNESWLEKNLLKMTALYGGTLLPPQDVQATLLAFTAHCNARPLWELEKQTNLPKQLWVCGGGAKNTVLMKTLCRLLPCWNVQSTTEVGVDADYVEASAFAWLAYRRLNNLPSNLPEVTGATCTLSLGVIYSGN